MFVRGDESLAFHHINSYVILAYRIAFVHRCPFSQRRSVTSIYRQEHEVLCKLLREHRLKSGLSQENVGKLMGLDQPIVARIEAGQRRIDIVELHLYCEAVGVPLLEFVEEWLGRVNLKSLSSADSI